MAQQRTVTEMLRNRLRSLDEQRRSVEADYQRSIFHELCLRNRLRNVRGI